MGMESKVITITPDMARDMLAKNMKNNRRLNHETVKRYARIMKAGGWNLTHQGIAFDDKGELIDGQHRLEALVAANVPVTMMVTYNVEHSDGEAFTIDVGARRTTQNIIQISGITDDLYKYMSPYIGTYIRLKARLGCGKAEPAEIISYIDRHYDALTEAYEVIGKSMAGGGKKYGSKLHTIMCVAIISAVYRGEDKEGLKKFVRVYCMNEVENCERYNARHALNIREYVRGHKQNAETLQRCECAIYAFIHDQAQIRICDRYPYQPALDA